MFPYRTALFGQVGTGAEYAAAEVVGAVEVAACAGEKVEKVGQQGIVETVVFTAVATVHFNSCAAEVFKFLKQVSFGGSG